jgi:CO/xanthine dehydrogenase FAD-binding subunit
MSYLVASNIEAALTSLREREGRARVIAGATDLFLEELPAHLIDLTVIPETTLLEEKDGFISIGAAVTHTAAALSPVVCSGAAALAEACSQLGSPQVRNIGTIGGNVVNAAPAADAAVALVALGAEALLVDTTGSKREEAVENLYAGYNRSVIDSTSEIMLRLIIRVTDREEGSAFIRFASRKALSLPMVNAAARVRVTDGFLQEVRLVVAPAGPAPTRLRQTEEMLYGKIPSEGTWAEVEASAAKEVEVRGSLLRCSEQYRRHLVGILAARVLRKAAERAIESKAGESL